MIKFFQKIRQKLLTENKFSKYLLYAIGEILLVVIGIMIALYVNNKNQERAQEKEIEAILVEIQNDIVRDLNFCYFYTSFFIKRDSIKNLVMNNKVSYEDLKTDRLDVSYLTNSYDAMTMQSNGYKQFSSKIDKMPKKYKPLILDLNLLYQQRVRDIEYDVLRYKETVFKNVTKTFQQFEWSGQDQFNGEMSEEQINYLLHNPQFKKDVMNTMNDAREVIKSISNYRPRALIVYFKIDEMLDGKGYETPMHVRNTSLADSTHVKPLVGKYEQISGPIDSWFGGTPIEILSKGKQLYLNREDKEEILLHYHHAFKPKFYISGSSLILKFQENEDLTIIGNNNLNERKWRKVKESN